jgi:rhomboid protease GluP
VLALACILPELALLGADLGLWGSPRWRGIAYAHGAFWVGLLHGWRPNYAGQPAAMFVTYGFLHGGLVHLLFNTVTLVSLGAAVIARVGQARFLVLYGTALLGGGAGFALLSRAPQPMVGASGALFGLAGALVAWAAAEAAAGERGAAARARALARGLVWPAALLVALNLVMFLAASGALAWEAHLGGFVVGLALAPLLARR